MPRRRIASVAVLAAVSLGWPRPAQGQTAAVSGVILPPVHFAETAPANQAPRTRRPARHRWTVELHGGLVGGSTEPPGFGTPPPPGTPFEAVNQLESPAIGSWFFGDGAKFLNAAVINVAAGQKLAPIDTFLTEGFTTRTRGNFWGGRLAYGLSGHVEVEFTLDRGVGDYGLDSSGTTGLQAAAKSFQAAWTTLLGGLPASVVTAGLGGTVTPGSETFSTVAVNVSSHSGRFSPYASAGLGVLANNGAVNALLTGNVQFAANGATKSETDAVTIAYTESHLEPVYVVGLGVLTDLTTRTGIRVDLHIYLSDNPDRTTVTTAPSTTGTATVEDLVTPYGQVYQFSGLPNVASTLSVPLSHVQTFTATGLRKQMAFAVGYYFRF